jgi:F0F1-type ATP synthase gamma subunit
MQLWRTVKQDQEQTQELRGLVSVYQELAASKMQLVREEITVAQSFYDGLRTLLEEVGADSPPPTDDSQPALIWISSSSGLFGDITERTRELFLDQLKTLQAKSKTHKLGIWVVGKVGVQFMSQWCPDQPFTALELTDETLERAELEGLLPSLTQYSQVIVVHSLFQNLVRQEPVAEVLSSLQYREAEILDSAVQQKRRAFLYEPSFSAVADVFSRQIATSVFQQMLDQSRLSKYASRMMNLDHAIEKIDDSLVQLRLAERKIRHRRAEQKQQSRVTRSIMGTSL